MNKSSNFGSKPIKFKPRKIPRYLPGSVHQAVLLGDLKEYNKHLYRIFTAETKLDTKPPKFHSEKYMKVMNLDADIFALRYVDKDNKNLLQKINAINRSHGQVDTFNPLAYRHLSKWSVKERELKEITKENKKIYKKLNKASSMYQKTEFDKDWKVMVKKIQYFAKFPLVMFQKKTKDEEIQEFPSISRNLDVDSAIKSKRPKCFLEFKIENGLVLGKVIIELYEDIVPNAVKNFLSICQNQYKMTYSKCQVHKIYKNKYLLSGDITQSNGKGGTSIYGDSFDSENYSLEHCRPAVVSMVNIGNGQLNSQFCITFDVMPELNGKHVVIGKVIKGAIHLYKVNDLGTRHGKPVVKVVISDCGVCKRNK